MCPLTALIPGTKPLKSRLRVVAVFGIKSEEAAYFHPSLFRGRCEWNQKKWLKLIFCSSCCRHQSKVGDVLALFLWIFLYLSRIRAVIWLEIHLKMPISFHIWLEIHKMLESLQKFNSHFYQLEFAIPRLDLPWKCLFYAREVWIW